MFTFRPIESAASIIEYHRDSLVGYYSEGVSEDGNARWIGRLQGRLLPQSEIGGAPAEASFAGLLRNRSPIGGGQLTPRARKKRRSGFDFACCAPKSVSMAHVMRGDDAILKIHRQCADEAFKFLEQFAAARIRRGGKYEDRRTGNLIAFATEHASSRYGDPHLHTHFVIPNVTWDSEECRYKALQTSEISKNLALATAIYRNRLAMKLIKLGYSLSDGADGKFEITGIPAELIREYSKSKERIDGKISEVESAIGHELVEADRRKIALGLRPKKMAKGEERAAFEKFREHMKKLGLGNILHPNFLKVLQNKLIAPSVSPKDAVNYAADHLFERNSVVSKSAFLKCAIDRLRGMVSYKKIFEELGERISSHTFLEWGDSITTSEMLASEQALIFMANGGMGKSESFLKRGGALWEFPKSLDGEQRRCLEQIIHSSDWLINVQGVAGAGKSFMLRTLAANLNRQGIGFVAVAPSSKATAELHELGSANVQTMQSLIAQGGNSRLRKGLLIVDEAGLVGTRDMEKLFGIAKKYDARILFSGDIRQHKSVPAGDALRLLQTRSEMKTFSLKEIRRQRDEKYRSAVRAIFNGDVNETVFKLKKINAIVESSSPLRHSHEVAEEYIRAQMRGENTLIVSPLWSEIEDISSAIRKRLFAKRHLDIAKSRQFCVTKSLSFTRAQKKNPQAYEGRNLYIEVFGKIAGVEPGIYRVANPQGEYLVLENEKGKKLRLSYSEADNFDVQEMRRIDIAPNEKLLLRGNLKAGRRTVLRRGELVVAKDISPDGTILLEDGRKIPPNFQAWTHGYAVTTHGSQGMTVDSVIVSCGDSALWSLTQEQFYVGISRGREKVKVFTTDIDEFTERIECSNERILAMELEERMRLEAARLRRMRENALKEEERLKREREEMEKRRLEEECLQKEKRRQEEARKLKQLEQEAKIPKKETPKPAQRIPLPEYNPKPRPDPNDDFGIGF